jgi:YD repeat-containing protein
VYDALNRPAWKVDGAGNVRRNVYDANGNVVEVQAYANALTRTAFDAWNGQSAPAVVPDTARDQRIRTVYDAANRATWSVDALGNATQRSYDASGKRCLQTQSRHPAHCGSPCWPGMVAWPPQVASDDALDQRVRNVYDAANRLTLERGRYRAV